MSGGAAALIAVLLLIPVPARAHAALLKSDPKAGSLVAAGIRTIRLEFSEEVVPDLCHVAIVDATGQTMNLHLSNDPHDVNALIAAGNRLGAGAYRVNWHVVSADGHAVMGMFVFSVAGAIVPPTRPTAATTTAPVERSPLSRQETNPYPTLAALARGIGIAALLALAGLLAFALRSMHPVPPRVLNLSGILACAGASALAVHLVLWVRYVEPSGAFANANWAAMLASGPGRMELLRTALAVTALLMLWPLRKSKLAVGFSLAAILVSAAIGHPASTHPLLSVPVIAVHLLAIAAWSGGVTWLAVLARSGVRAIGDEAHRVSRAALGAAILVVVTGTIESALLLTAPSDLVSTAYGQLLLAKVAGLVILIAFGWYHRSRTLPVLAVGEPLDISSSLRYEIAVMTAVIIVAGFLSYTPLPR